MEEQFHTTHSGLVLHVHERVRLALPTPSSTGAGIGGGNRRYCDKKEFACGGHHPYAKNYRRKVETGTRHQSQDVLNRIVSKKTDTALYRKLNRFALND